MDATLLAFAGVSLLLAVTPGPDMAVVTKNALAPIQVDMVARTMTTDLPAGALEATLGSSAETGRFCHGDSPTMADCCLVPQIYNAERFAVSIEPYPILQRINTACLQLQAFQRAAPEAQADAP